MSVRAPLILLPPSEGKAPGGDGPPWSPGSMAVDLDRRRIMVIGALRRVMREDEASRAKLLGVHGKALEAATAADLALRRAPTLPAIERYTGVLYEALDAGSLTPAERRRLDGSVVIFSGLWGLVTPGDLIPDYRLKMGARLGTLGVLSAWWRADLTARLAALAAGRRVWNLLPNEHAAAWRPPATLPQWSVRFLDRAPDGSLVAVSHRNKALKGALVRFLTAHPSAGAEDLAAWDHPDGYLLQPALTEERGGTTVLSLVRGDLP
jgi:cytoplasmic iron level regulating protein YaaA (DUF328/UPF0246 family)